VNVFRPLRIALAALCLALAMGAPAMALDLEQARAQGLVGEQADGYVGVVTSTPETQALAASVNAQRRAAYADIASRNGTTPDAVAALTAERVIARLPRGSWVRDSTGAWVRK
jgi:uncharacterized protein YdbL (DUF1318 family)